MENRNETACGYLGSNQATIPLSVEHQTHAGNKEALPETAFTSELKQIYLSSVLVEDHHDAFDERDRDLNHDVQKREDGLNEEHNDEADAHVLIPGP